MTYDEITSVALSYSDRESDAELPSKLDSFLRIVESRVDRVLKTQKMTIRTLLNTVQGQEYYGLPADFAGLRDIEIRGQDNIGGAARERVTLEYLTPEQMNSATGFSAGTGNIYYTIIANQLQISPTQDNMVLELVYYRKLPNLTANDNTNWLSDDNPDTYVFGLMVEISAFVKNPDATSLWNSRFKESLGEIDLDDSKARWSGSMLTVTNS